MTRDPATSLLWIVAIVFAVAVVPWWVIVASAGASTGVYFLAGHRPRQER